jgi:hypothetical protein
MTTYEQKLELLTDIHIAVDPKIKKQRQAESGETRFGTMVRTSNRQNIGYQMVSSHSPIAFSTKSFD